MAVQCFPLDNTQVVDFFGYRVARSVGGIVRQRYFSLRDNGSIVDPTQQRQIHDQALACDEIWRLEAQAIRAAKSMKAEPSPRARSGSPVAGICAQRITKRAILDDGRRGRRFYSAWTVAVADNPHRRFYLTTDGDRLAFAKAVDCLCAFKGWSSDQAEHLKGRWVPHRFGSNPVIEYDDHE